MSGANRATKMITPTMPSPTSAPGFRRNRRSTSRLRTVEGAASASGAASAPAMTFASVIASASVIANARIDQRVADVDEQVDDHEHDDDEQDPALQHGVVARADGVVDPRPDPAPGEHGLGEDRPRQQQ